MQIDKIHFGKDSAGKVSRIEIIFSVGNFMCPSFAALCEKLFTSAAQLLGNRWHGASDKKKIDWLLNGISTADFQISVRLFQLVQSFISLSNCFC